MSFVSVEEARDIFLGELNECSQEDIDRSLTRQIQYALNMGAPGSIREWCLWESCGYFTLPPDLKTPIYYRIDGQYGEIPHGSMWKYTSNAVRELSDDYLQDWFAVENNFHIVSGYVASEHAIREPGELVLVSTSEKDVGAEVLIRGERNGKEIFSPSEGQTAFSGEKLRISCNKDGVKPDSTYHTFDKLLSVEKRDTYGYLVLWVFPKNGKPYPISCYAPYENNPAYQRAELQIWRDNRFIGTGRGHYQISIIGRIRFYEELLHQNSTIPIDDYELLSLLALREKFKYRRSELNNARSIEQDIANYIPRMKGYAQIGKVRPTFRPQSTPRWKNGFGW